MTHDATVQSTGESLVEKVHQTRVGAHRDGEDIVKLHRWHNLLILVQVFV